MSLNPIPHTRPGVAESEMSWNELFYLCLQKPVWIILCLIIFAVLAVIYSLNGLMRDALDIVVLAIWAVGAAYLPAALPVSIVFATWKRARYRK
ncbi:MAG: hypothetical protein Q4Q04_00790 [Methanocorpusculum sp.]|nr:hypothetical protein [Methanocorpusculum sp.]